MNQFTGRRLRKAKIVKQTFDRTKSTAGINRLVDTEAPPSPAHDARERILSAAVPLFAESGFDAVGVRAIAAAARVNIAAVNYHFGSKDALIVALCERIISNITAQRIIELDRVEAGTEAPTTEAILAAFIRPAVRFADPAERSNLLIARLVISHATRHNETLGPVLRTVLTPATTRFAAALAKSLPGASHDTIAHGLHLTVGALLHTITCSEKLAELFPDLPPDSDPEVVTRRIATYAAAGLRALAVEAR